jgi:hypothetical protein
VGVEILVNVSHLPADITARVTRQPAHTTAPVVPTKSRQSDRRWISPQQEWCVCRPGHRRSARRYREQPASSAQIVERGQCALVQSGAQRIWPHTVGNDHDYRHSLAPVPGLPGRLRAACTRRMIRDGEQEE